MRPCLVVVRRRRELRRANDSEWINEHLPRVRRAPSG
jgi:hypothetical protein